MFISTQLNARVPILEGKSLWQKSTKWTTGKSLLRSARTDDEEKEHIYLRCGFQHFVPLLFVWETPVWVKTTWLMCIFLTREPCSDLWRSSFYVNDVQMRIVIKLEPTISQQCSSAALLTLFKSVINACLSLSDKVDATQSSVRLTPHLHINRKSVLFYFFLLRVLAL